jgi:hypothetical protein
MERRFEILARIKTREDLEDLDTHKFLDDLDTRLMHTWVSKF